MSISREAKNAAYGRMQSELLQKIIDENLQISDLSQLDREKFVYSTVMWLATLDEPVIDTNEVASFWFTVYDNVLIALGSLTPIELERIFPIAKEYHGKRWGMKDYFTAKAALKKLPQCEPIRRNMEMIEFLWDYHNDDLIEFYVGFMCCMSDIRRLNGEPSIMEEFAQNNGIPTCTKFEGANGKEYLRNNDTGEINKLHRPFPRYLKVVK